MLQMLLIKNWVTVIPFNQMQSNPIHGRIQSMSNFDLTIACAIAMPTVKILVCEIVHDIAYRVQSEKKLLIVDTTSRATQYHRNTKSFSKPIPHHFLLYLWFAVMTRDVPDSNF